MDKNVVTSIEQLRQMYNLEDIESNKQSISQVTGVIQSTNAELANFVTQVTEDITDLQAQVDGTITSWFYEGEPTLLNLPASDWLESEYESHRGDLYYDQTTGYAYRFSFVDDEYLWVRLSDTDATLALSIANAAKDTADSKRRTFVTTPTTPYDVGDIWFGNDTNDLKRAQTARTAEESYNVADWIKAVKYTDDSTFNVVIDKINTSPEATKIATTKLSADVITTGNLSAQTISAGQITTGTLATARLNSDVITTSNFSAQNINADKINSGTLTSVALNAGSGKLRIYSSGDFRYYNDPGFLVCGTTDHPYASALNVSKGDGNGLVFVSGINYSSVGSPMGHITMNDSERMDIYSDGNIQVRASGNSSLTSSTSSTSNYARINGLYASASSSYDWLAFGASAGSSPARIRSDGNNMHLFASSGGSLYAGGTTDGYKIKTDSYTPSSLNVKENLIDMKNKYADLYKEIQSINSYDYDYKYNGIESNNKGYGFIIDEIEKTELLKNYFINYDVKKVVTDDNKLIDVNPDDPETNNVIDVKVWSTDAYVKGLFVLIKTLQEKIDKLEERIEKIERGE